MGVALGSVGAAAFFANGVDAVALNNLLYRQQLTGCANGGGEAILEDAPLAAFGIVQSSNPPRNPVLSVYNRGFFLS